VTIQDLQQALPSKKKFITDEAVAIINSSVNEPEFQGESLLKTAVTYEAVLQRNKASVAEYLNAIRFCAYLRSTDDNITEAYKKTFYERDFVKQRMSASTTSSKYRELTSAASRYRKSKLVLDLILAGARYKAIEVLTDLMTTAKLDRDKINAAKELLAATKGPDNLKIELDVGMKANSAVEQLNEQLSGIAASQKMLLDAGASTVGEFGAMTVKDDTILEGEVV